MNSTSEGLACFSSQHRQQGSDTFKGSGVLCRFSMRSFPEHRFRSFGGVRDRRFVHAQGLTYGKNDFATYDYGCTSRP